MRKSLLLSIIFVFLGLAACTHRQSIEELCSQNNTVYVLLEQNHVEWSRHFDNEEFAEPIIVYSGFQRFIVQSMYQTHENEPILSIAVDQGLPATRLGNTGLAYIPDDQIDQFGYDEHEIQIIDNNIYCYFIPETQR